jgi:hypothetical protein
MGAACRVRPTSVSGFPRPWLTIRLPCASRIPPVPPRQEPLGPPKFLTLLSTHTTLFVDPGRPSGISPTRSLCVGFWGVKPIAICVSAHNGAVSSFGECGLPYGLRGSLCTLHLCRSVSTSFTGATLGRSGWLDLTPQGLAPCKKRQASLGAPTPGVSRCWKRERSGRCKASAAVLGSAGCAPWGCGGGPAHTTTPDPLYAAACPFHTLIERSCT